MNKQEVINDMCKIIRDASLFYNSVYLSTQYHPNEPYLSLTEFIAQKLYENDYRKKEEE